MMSDNRTLRMLTYHPWHGRSFWKVRCSCGSEFDVYLWSFHGCGKKCPSCGFLHSVLSVEYSVRDGKKYWREQED